MNYYWVPQESAYCMTIGAQCNIMNQAKQIPEMIGDTNHSDVGVAMLQFLSESHFL